MAQGPRCGAHCPGSVVLCPAAQSNGLGIATPAVDPHTVTRAKLTNAELATAILQSGRRLVLYCLLETWLLDPDPRAWARWCRDPGPVFM